MEDTHQEFYANAVNVTTGVYDVTLNFRTQSPVFFEEGEPPTLEVTGTCSIRMSPQHAKSLVALLVKHVKDYEGQHGVNLPVPNNIREVWEEYIK